jgi:Tol biopolymer transport system component
MPSFVFIRILFRPGLLLALGLLLRLSPIIHVSERAHLPARTICFDSNRTGNFEIYTMRNDGTNQVRLTSDRTHDSFWPKLSPDRTKILFVRTPAGVHDTDYKKVTTWIMNADGTGLTRILSLGAHGWTLQGHPEWKPDGSQIAIIGGASANSQIYIINPNGSNPVRVTNNGHGGPRGGMNLDPSWSPSGEHLLFIGCPYSICLPTFYEIYRIQADGTMETRLTNDHTPDYDPYYSPDAREEPGAGVIAWLRNTGSNRWAIFRMNTNGTGQTSVIDDGGINSKPGWALDSSTIYFHRIPPHAPPGTLFNLWKVSPSGNGLTEVILPRPVYVNEFPINGIH